MELKEALKIVMKHDVKDDILTDEQEEAYSIVNNSDGNFNLTDEEKQQYSSGILEFMMCCKKNRIKRKFYDEYNESIQKYCSYSEFEKQLDDIIKRDPDYTLDIIKPTDCHKTIDEMIKDVIYGGLLPEKKDIVYRLFYINRFYNDAAILSVKDKKSKELENMKKEIYKMYDLIIDEIKKDKETFKKIYDNYDVGKL